MNLTEKNTVIDFLKSKKLSYPLYKEVLDHFFLDIDQKMLEGMGFQEAFIHVKLKWHDEFKMVSPDNLSFRKVAKIEADAMQSKFRNIIKISGLFAMVSALFGLIYEPSQLYILGIIMLVLATFTLFLLFRRKIRLSQYFSDEFPPFDTEKHHYKRDFISMFWNNCRFLL
ncbi:MAG: hypothetical protein ITF99_04600 [Chryseobacterium sp.]|nr:hypothetical protein [Chryseobacterium sp.]